MWLWRRMCSGVADARPSATVVEALEARRLLTAAGAASDAGASWDLVDADGVCQGHATLAHGVLKVTATDGNDEATIGTNAAPGRFYVMINRASVSLETADVRGVEIDFGAGDDALDFFNFGQVLDLPVTVNGGAGNDSLVAQRDRNNYDDPIAFMNAGPFAPVTLIGGEGNDDLHAGIGDCTMDGGPGDDTFEHGWGHDKIRDKDKVKPDKPADSSPTVEPAPTLAPDAAPTKPAVDEHAAGNVENSAATTVLPAAFSVMPLSEASDGLLLHGPTDDRLTA